MLSVQSTQLKSRVATSQAGNNSSETETTVQGSNWFREKNALAENINSTDGPLVKNSSAEAGHIVEWVDDGTAETSSIEQVAAAVIPADDDETQRISGSNPTLPTAHTSTRVKTLTPFCPRSRRGPDDRPLSVSPNPLSTGRLSEDSAEYNFTGSMSSLHPSLTGEHSAPQIQHLPQSAADITRPSLVITTQNSSDLNKQLFELAKDVNSHNSNAHGSREDGPLLASSTPTLTVQTTSTRATAVIQQATDASNVEANDIAGSFLRANQAVVSPGGHSRSVDILQERTSPRPRATIFGDIRERVFGGKQPSSTQQPQQQTNQVQQYLQKPKQQQLSTKFDSNDNVGKMKEEEMASCNLKMAPLAIAEDDLIDNEQNELTSSVSCEVVTTEQNVVSSESASSLAQQSEKLKTDSQNAVGRFSTEAPFLQSQDNPINRPVAAQASDEAQIRTTDQKKSAPTSAAAVWPASPAGVQQPTPAPIKADELSKQQQAQKQQRPVAKAEVSPWRMIEYPGTQYGFQQPQKTAETSSGSNTPVRQMATAAQERIEMSLPSPTAEIGGFVATATTASQLPLTAKVQKSQSLMQYPGDVTPLGKPDEDLSQTGRIGSAVNAAAGNKIVPSSVSRVDWAKQRFGAAQSLDSSGFAFVPEAQPRRMSGESSPKLVPRHMKTMSTVSETAAAMTSIEELPSSPGAFRRMLALTASSGGRSVSSTSVPITSTASTPSRSDAEAKATLASASIAASAAGSSISGGLNGSSKIAIVHGQQVTPPVTGIQQGFSLQAANTTVGARAPISQIVPSTSAMSMTSSMTRQHLSSQSHSNNNQPLSTNANVINVSQPVRPGPQTATTTSAGSCFSLRLPGPVFVPTATATQKPSGIFQQQKTATLLDNQPAVPNSSVTSDKLMTSATARRVSNDADQIQLPAQQKQASDLSNQLQLKDSQLEQQQQLRLQQQRLIQQQWEDSRTKNQTIVDEAPSDEMQFTAIKSKQKQQLLPAQTFCGERNTAHRSGIVPVTSLAPAGFTTSASAQNTRDSITQAVHSIQDVKPPVLTGVNIEAPSIDQVIARPALPTVKAFISMPTVPEVCLTAVSLRPAMVIQSAVHESVLVPIVTSTQQTSVSNFAAAVPERTLPNEQRRNVMTSLTPTSGQSTSTLSPRTDSVMSVNSGSTSQHRELQVQHSSAATEISSNIQKVQAPAQLQTGNVAPGVRHESAELQNSNRALAITSSTESRSPAPVNSVAAILPTSHAVPVNTRQPQQPRNANVNDLTGSTRRMQLENLAVSQSVSLPANVPATVQQRGQQMEAQRHEPVSILKKQPTEPLVIDTSSPATRQVTTTSRITATQSEQVRQPQHPQQGKAGHQELKSALAELDSIAAETRQLSKSLSFPTTSPHQLQVSPTASSARLQGSRSPDPTSSESGSRSLISAVTAALDAKLQGKTTTVHPKLAALHETRSLDRSGIARRQLEQLTHPTPGQSTSGAGIHKTVTLRKPRPLRKAQTVSLTGLGLGVDPDLMSLLASRKEKSASDDEDQKTPSPSRPEISIADDDDSEKLPSVSERIKRMETKKIRFSVLREKAAQRRMAQSMESLGSPGPTPDSGRLQQPLWANEGSATDTQAKLDRLACFAAISDTSVGMKRRQLQRRQMATGRRLSLPVTLEELTKAETLQSVVSFNEHIRGRLANQSQRFPRRWAWPKQPTPRDRVASGSKRGRRRRSLPSSSCFNNASDGLSARQRAIMLRSSRYNVALPARVHSTSRVVVSSPVDESPSIENATIIGHGPLTFSERNSSSLSSSSRNISPSTEHFNSSSKMASYAEQRSPHLLSTSSTIPSSSSTFPPSSMSFVSSGQLEVQPPQRQDMVTRPAQRQQQHDTMTRLEQHHQHHETTTRSGQQQQLFSNAEQRLAPSFPATSTPMAAAARLVLTTSSTAATSQMVTMSRPPIDRSRNDDHTPTVSQQRKQHPVQPIRRIMQRMDSLDDDEFDKMVEVNIRQLQVDSSSTSSAVSPELSAVGNTLSVQAASTQGALSPRSARRVTQQPQSPVQTGYSAGDQSRTSGVNVTFRGDLDPGRSVPTRNVAMPNVRLDERSVDDRKQHQQRQPQQQQKQQQQQQQQQAQKDEESEDELSKLSIAEKLKLFSGKKSLSAQQREAESVAAKNNNSFKSKRQSSRYQTQISDAEPVTWDELEQASRNDGRYRNQQPMMTTAAAGIPAVTSRTFAQTQSPKYHREDASSHMMYYRDY